MPSCLFLHHHGCRRQRQQVVVRLQRAAGDPLPCVALAGPGSALGAVRAPPLLVGQQLAQHLTAELVGRYRDDRPALSAIALHAETSSLTAIANDYGWDHGFARQVQAHGRPGDVFLGLSTSGRSANVLSAMQAAHDGGLQVWALTGPGPNPMLELAGESVAVAAPSTATVQEVHQVAVHLLCAAVDLQVGADEHASSRMSDAEGARA